jgi:hypothetical protein
VLVKEPPGQLEGVLLMKVYTSHCGTDEYSNYTTEDYNDLMGSFNNMIGVSE